MKKTIIFLIIAISISSCSYFKSKKLNGTFIRVNDSGLFIPTEFKFQDDKIIMDFFSEMAYDYEIKGNNIYLKNSQFPIVIKIVDSKTLEFEDCLYKKKNN